MVGVIVTYFVKDGILAIGLALSLAIAMMSIARCLHPPGGAAALTAILGGPAVASAGFVFPFVPVGLNSVLLVLLGYMFHRISRRSYPHRVVAAANVHGTKDLLPERRVGFRSEDIDPALESLSESFDISPEDLGVLLERAELQATLRVHGGISAEQLMSRDVVTVGIWEDAKVAQSRLLNHNVRSLPVIDREGKLVGTIGLRELLGSSGEVAQRMSPALTTSLETPAVSLVPTFLDGKTHAIVVTGPDQTVQGLISQTDLLAATWKLLQQRS